MKKIFFSVTIAAVVCLSAAAQTLNAPLPQMFSPNAAEMGKYGRTPVNYFNGLPSIIVPLTEVQAKGYTLPVYLTYHASGNKPDQHPGWVGQGWTLHAGGAISRIINGQRDEMTAAEYGFSNSITPSYNPGYFYHMAETQTNSNWEQESTLVTVASVLNVKDYEPDEFMISIEGIQASFFFVAENEIRIVSRSDASFDVEYELVTETSGPGLVVYPHPTNDSGSLKAYRFTYIRSLTVSDREGNKYYFGGDDSAIEYSIIPKPSFRIENETLYNNNVWNATAVPNSWMLTRIERADGEEITFSYVKDGTPVVECDTHHGETYTITQGHPGEGANFDTRDNPSFKNNLSFFFLQPSYLTKIKCRISKDSLVFAHTPTTEMGYGISENDFNLRVGNYDGSYGGPYTFANWMSRSYYNQLSAIDGAGRHIAFSYTASTTERLKLQQVQFKTAAGSTGTVDNKYTFTYNTSTMLPGYNAKQTDIWGFYNGTYYGNDVGSVNAGSIRTPDATKMQAEILMEMTYPTGGKTVFEYEPHTYSKVVTIYPAGLNQETVDKMAGGLRIKSITDYPGGGKQDKRTYSYDNPLTVRSSGILSGSPRCRTTGHVAFHDTLLDYEIDYVIYSENPVFPLSETDGNHVTYSYVKETFPDGGYTSYTYSNHDTNGCIDEDPANTLGYSQGNTPYSRIQSRSLQRGLLLKRTDSSSNNAVIREETNTYSDTQVFFKSVAEETYCVNAFTVLSYVKKYCYYPALSEKVITTYPDTGSAYTETYTYQYNTDRRLTNQTHSVGGVTDGTVTFYPADRNGTTYTAMRQAGMSGIPVGQATLRNGNVVAAQEMTFKETAVSTSAGTSFTFVPEAVYAAELTAPVSYTLYSSNPLSYCSDPDVRYLCYDNHANLTGTETRDGIRTTYAWDVSARQPALVARGVDPGQTTIGDVSRQQSYSLVYGQSNSFSGSYVSAQSSTITFTLQAAYGYDWLASVQIDGQAGHVVQVAIPETPPSQWMQYLTQYSNGSIQFTVPAGSHTYWISLIDVRKGTGASSNNGGTIQITYSEKGTVTTAGEPLLFVDFENETTFQPGCHGQHCHSGSYTVNVSVGATRNYVLDYMLYQNGAWSYQRQSYSGGSLTLGGTGQYLDDIRVFPADCDLATAGYGAANLLTSRTDARGVTERYEYDALRRLTLILNNDGNPVEQYSYNYAHGSGNTVHNSVTTKTYKAANSTTDYRTAVSYLDSLGRPTQNILVNGAASGWDLITYQDYDVCGRDYRKWLPAPIQVGSGHTAGAYATLSQIQTGGNQVYPSTDSYRYEQPVYEASPRDRVLEYYGPGSAWRSGSGHKVKTLLKSNTALIDTPEFFRGFTVSWTGSTALTITRLASSAASGTMLITQTEDEDGHKTLEFKNSFGETVLIRKVMTSSTFLDTYYVYDDFGQLAAVLPPLFVAQMGSTTSWNYSGLADYAYLYRYDSRGNCIARSIPGAGWIYTVYDKGNRPILTQDAAQRAQNTNYWTFALSDHLGRDALRGTTTMSVSAFSDPYKTTVVKASLPKTPTYSGSYKGYTLTGITLSSPVLLEVDYYDNYSFAGTSPFPAANNADFAYDSSIGTTFSAYYSPSAQGLQTGSLLKVLDNSTGNQYLWSVSYYDYMARVVQHRSSTHIGGVEKDWFLYDFVGNATKHKTEHKPGSGTSLIETTTQSYDTWDRPLVTTHLIGTSGTATTVSDKAYDKAGRLYTESRSGNTSLKSTYAYNIRSWLTGITGTLFTETLKYQDGTTARWGGDVSQLSWKDNRSSNLKTYSLSYDTVGRLKTASFSDAGNTSVNYAEKVAQYDDNGNIKKLERYGRTGASTYGKIDDLVYTYSGNKVTSIKDTGGAAYSSDFRFSNGTNTSYAFTYDDSGRMTSDASKGITSITWNVLGLPQTVTFSSGAVINYSYAADGTKLREAKTVSSTTTLTDYTGNLILENGTRSRLLFDGGYVSVPNSAYHFFITDHLGSVRVVASTSGTAEEYNHYYPLGGPIAQYSSLTSLQPIKFQGKEWSAGKGLDLYDFVARRYDPATGRWISQDPLAEKYYAHSPYLFCAANPMRYVDPEGKIWYSINSEGHITVVDEEKNGPDRLYSNYPPGGIGPVMNNDFIEVSDPRILKSLSSKLGESHVREDYWDDSEELAKVFSFVSGHSNVEWLIRSFKKDDGGFLFNLVTDHDPGSVTGRYVDRRARGVSIRDMYAQIHSHPGESYTPPSGDFNARFLSGFSDAMSIRSSFTEIYGEQAPLYYKARPYFYMYHPASSSLTRYTMYSGGYSRETVQNQSLLKWLK